MKQKFLENNIARVNLISNYKLYDYCNSIQDANETLLEKITYTGSNIIQYFTTGERIKRFLEFNHYKTYVFIFTVSSSASLIFIFIQKVTALVIEFQNYYFINNFWSFLVFNLICTLLATGICDYFSKEAQGSGIPELKTILTGVEYQNFFTFKTALVKYISIFFVRIGGLGTGFEGAFMHIAAFLGDYFSKKIYFRDLQTKEYKLAIVGSICVSLVIAFGSPIGGVILTLELFGDNFEMHNMLKSFFASTISYFFYTIINNHFKFKNIHEIFVNPAIDTHIVNYWETPLFIGCGVFCGGIASIFLFIYTYFLQIKAMSKSNIFSRY